MNSETEYKTVVVNKLVIASQDSIAAQKGNLVKLKIWNHGQSQNKSVTAEYLLGNNQLDEQIQKIVYQMKVGDTWLVKNKNRITQKQQTINISVLSSQKYKLPLQQLPVAPINTRADALKKQGNDLIKQKNYTSAIQSYRNAYNMLQFCSDQQAVQLRLSIISNLALASLNSNKFRECIDWCDKYNTESIQLNKKIMYRDICAYKGLREWKTAKQKIEKAIQLFNDDQDAIKDYVGLRQIIEKQQKVQSAKQKKLYSNMLG